MKLSKWCCCATSTLLFACSNSDNLPEIGAAYVSKYEQDSALEDGNKLTDLAGKPTVPNTIDDQKARSLLTEKATQYIGRYRAEVDCTDRFVDCNDGTANFIINLLPNGIAHRTIVHMGKVTFALSHQYRQDYWSYDEIYHQIILHRENGIKVFYFVDDENNLIMDLDKIANATEKNRQFFSENPLPQYAYHLKKRSSI